MMPSTLDMPNTLTDCYQPISADLVLVQQQLVLLLPPDSEWMIDALAHVLGGGGKLMRPALMLLASAASQQTTGPLTPEYHQVAAVTEMIHVATLLHDDVLDDAPLRRGKPTVNTVWGNTVSVLSGDFLLARASRMLADVGRIELVALYSDVLGDLCDGEVEQLRTRFNLPSADWETYYRKSICKTATLFRAGCRSAGILNGLDDATIEALSEFGKHLGIAFQVVDDMLDYTASEASMGKPVFDDLKNGLVNAPMLLALESPRLSAAEQATLRELIQSLFDTLAPVHPLARLKEDDECRASSPASPQEGLKWSDRDHERVKALMVKADALNETCLLADRLIQQAVGYLAPLPEGPAKQSLWMLANLVVQRKH